MDNKKKFWLENPEIIFKDYLDIIPNKNMNEIEIYNSIFRFCLYLIIILLIFYNKNKYLKTYIYICLCFIIITIILYYVKINDDTKINKTIEEPIKGIEGFENNTFENNEDNYFEQFDLNNNKNIIRRNIINDDMEDINNKNYEVEVGYYDSDNKIRFNRTTGKINKDKTPFIHNINYSCKKPTKDNPFMNPDIDDYKKKEPVVACNTDDEDIPEQITKSFNEDMYLNFDDTFEKKNFQRQFLTSPNTTIPNHQTEFAEWLFKTDEICKENQEKCLKYTDIRYNRM